ncbi:hypothetical protein KSC_022350 [Ktedonobacter sp. SOSP1-52]|nr:hypothetical protein KSC_022350 [Ktedonobacter sp. SOSP1-52]
MNPTVNGGVIYAESSFSHEFFEVAVTEVDFIQIFKQQDLAMLQK